MYEYALYEARIDRPECLREFHGCLVPHDQGSNMSPSEDRGQVFLFLSPYRPVWRVSSLLGGLLVVSSPGPSMPPLNAESSVSDQLKEA
jgi:hypothetical protein